LLAWAFTGGGGKPMPSGPAQGSPQASSLRSALAYGGSPTASSSNRTNGVGPSLASPTPSGPPAPSVSPGGVPGSGSAPTAAAQAPVGPGGTCLPRTLVLSVFTSRPSYSSGQYPEFDVYAVSTAAGHCALDLGPAKLTVVVMSSGRVIWDSADCARGDPGRVAELSRGVPAQESIVWNRVVSLPGCVTLASARPGAYQVQARTGAVSSPVRAFKLVH
jgi:hypothetical protein